MKHIKSYIFFLILIFLPTTSFPTSITGKVISVADGDTITILTPKNEQIKVRLSAVDCPEKQQAFGQKAKDFTSSMVAGKQVTIEPDTIDKYGRTVAMIYVNGSNLNKEVVSNGYGWVYRKYCHKPFCEDWLKLEEKARNAGIGLWADKNPTPPWEWRHNKKNSTRSNVTGGSGTYHGNTNSHVFHGYGCKNYNCKNCTVEFNSVSDAVAAGYHAHNECVTK